MEQAYVVVPGWVHSEATDFMPGTTVMSRSFTPARTLEYERLAITVGVCLLVPDARSDSLAEAAENRTPWSRIDCNNTVPLLTTSSDAGVVHLSVLLYQASTYSFESDTCQQDE